MPVAQTDLWPTGMSCAKEVSGRRPDGTKRTKTKNCPPHKIPTWQGFEIESKRVKSSQNESNRVKTSQNESENRVKSSQNESKRVRKSSQIESKTSQNEPQNRVKTSPLFPTWNMLAKFLLSLVTWCRTNVGAHPARHAKSSKRSPKGRHPAQNLNHHAHDVARKTSRDVLR